MTLATQATTARDAGFQDRVEAAAVATARNVYSEATTLAANVASGANTQVTVTPNLSATIAAGVVVAVGGETFVVGTGGAASGQGVIPCATGTTFTRAHLIGELVSPPSLANHAARAVLATNVERAPDQYRSVFAWLVSTIEDGNLSATDTAISNDVSAVWNGVAGA